MVTYDPTTTQTESTTATSPYYIARIVRDTPFAVHYQTIVDRIASFAYRHNANAATLIDEVWARYASKSPYLALCGVFDSTTNKLVGHGVAVVRDWDGAHVGWIHQLDFDVPVSRNLIKQILLALDSWAYTLNTTIPEFKTHPIRRYLMISKRGRESRVWERHSGFSEYGTLYSREVT